MKAMIEKIFSARVLALMVAVCATSGAWAAITATEVWEANQIKENYNSGTGLITGYNNSVYKLNVGSGLVVDDTSGAFTLGSDGSITVNSTATHGATIDLTATGSDPTTISILVKYRSLSACTQASLVSAFMTRDGTKPECGLIQTADNALTLKPYWYIASNSSGYNFNISTPSVSTSGGYLLFSYDRNNIKGYTGSALNSMSGGSATMAWTGPTFKTAAIGGSSGEVTDSSFNNKWPNMVIEKIALFVGNAYTGSDLAAYVFPSEDPSSSYDYIKTITANTALSEITSWEKGTGTPGPDAKVYIICENDAVFTIDDDLEVEKLWVDGGSIALADGASIGSAEVLGAPITVAAATSAAISDSTVLSAITANGTLNVSGSELRNTITCNGTMSVTGTSTISGAVTCNGTMSVSGNSTISGAVSGSGSNNSMTIANTTVTGAISCSDHFTLNIRDSTINGGITAAQNGQATINTYGTVSFGSSANNDFKYSNSFNIKSGTTTYNSSGDQKLWCNITVDTGATLVNAKQDSLNYSQNSSYPIHTYIYGTLTMDQKWTLGSVDRIHLYDGALINGNAANAIHPNQSGGKGYIIAEDGTSVITASVANGNATIDLTVKEGATLSMISTPTITTRSGSGLLLKRVDDNTRWDGSGVPANYNGVELYSSGLHGGNDDQTFLNSSYTDYIKVTTADGDFRSFGYVVAGDFTNPVFSDRPTLELAGDMRVYQSTADKPLTVKNLSGTGDVRNYNDSDNLTYKYIDTLQTKNTTYSGGFKNIDSCSDCDPALTVRGADNAAAIYALTLSGVNDTTAPLTIDNNAKVIFPSSGGSWASGAVTVADGGYLETQSATALGAVTLQDGATIVIPTVSDAVVPLTGTTVTLPTSGTVEVDLSGVSAEVGDVVTVISATTLVNANASIFSARGWQFSVDENSIKATKLGTLTWSSGSWSDNNFAGYTAAEITASGTQDVTLPASATIDSLTLTGSGTVTLKPTSSEALTVSALSIGSGVTLNASSSLVLAAGCTISGDGSLNIPSGVTLVMDGVGCSAKVTVSGTLETSGTTELSAANTSAQGSLLHIVGGATTLASAWKGIAGNITIDYGATLTMGASYNGASNTYWEHFSEQSSTCVDIGGTLNMGGYIWFFGANNSVKLRSRAEVNGSGRSGSSSYGNWVWMNDGPADGALHAYGNATIDLTINTIGGKSPRFEIDTGATLEIRKDFTPQDGTYYAGGSITKSGAGTLDLTALTPTKPITINAGTVVAVTAPTTAVVNEAGILKLTNTGSYKDDRTVNLSGITGTGTIRYNGSGWRSLPNSSGNVFADTLSVELEQESGVPIVANNTVIGSISGSKNLRSDLGSSGKTFTVKQAKDGVWSGSFHGGWDGLTKFVVQGGASSNGTLTLAGTTTADGDNTYNDELEVASSGSVNLTGSWIGDTTVYGTFGGTGTLDGALTFNAGSTFKMWESGSLSVSDSLTLPDSGTVAVDVSAIADSITSSGVTLITSTGNIDSETDISALTVTSGYFLKAETDVLKVYPLAAEVKSQIDGSTLESFASVADAIAYAVSSPGRYVEVYESATVECSVESIYVVKGEGVTLTLNYPGSEYQYSETEMSGVYWYRKVNKASAYTWNPTISTGDWTADSNWLRGDVPAERYPQDAGDTVAFNSDVSVNISGISIGQVSIGEAEVTFTVAQLYIDDEMTLTLTTADGIVLTSPDAQLVTTTCVGLSADPITTVDGKMVHSETVGTTTTYTVVDIVASAVINTETVYFDDIEDAFAEITADHSVTVTIVNESGDYDDYDDRIAELGFFREGANVKFLAAERRNINGSLIAQYSSAQEAIDADDGLTIICICAEATVSARVTRPMFIKPVGILLDDITINCYLAGYSYVKPDSDLSPTYPGVYQIDAQASAATFTWNSSVASGNWDTIGNWVSEDGEVGFVPNNSAWDVVLNTDATITMGNSRTVGHLSVGAAVDIRSSDNKELTLTDTDGVELTSASASITLTRQGGSGLTKVNLTSTPYTLLEGMYVKTSDPTGSATVYEVATKVASVTDSGSNVTYYDSLATAVSSASTGDSIALFANSSEAITLNNKTINFSEGSYTFTGTFTGNGTVVLSAALKAASSDRWPVGWTGTVELKNITTIIENFSFAHYGNANSKVIANNVLVRMPSATSGEFGAVKEIELQNEGLRFGGDYIYGERYTFSAKLTGTGKIRVGTPAGDANNTEMAYRTRYVFNGDISEFTGGVDYNGLGSYRAIIVFSTADESEEPGPTDWGQIIVTKKATLKTSGTLDGAGGFIVKGAINVLSGGSITTGGEKIGGDGLIVLTEGSSGALSSSKFNSTTWTGTVELKDITTAIANFDFANYGTVNSTVRANNVKVKENYSAIGNVGCIDIAAGGLTFGDSSAWNNDNTVTIAADITGSGSIVVATCDNPDVGYNSYVFTGDLTGFSGSLKAQAYNATYNSIIVIKGDGDAIPTATGVGQMFITENATVNVGASATWTATTLTIDGTMSVASGGTLSGTIAGSGTVSFAATPGESALTFGSWTGTVEIPAHTIDSRLNLNAYGKIGSTVKFGGMSVGWIYVGAKDVNPDLYLTGDFCPASMSQQTYTFRKVTGTGSISFPSSSPSGLSISEFAKIDGYAGSIVNNSTATLSIGTLSLPAGADVSCGAKLLSTDGTGTITVGSITVGGVALSNVSYSRNTSGAEGDGFYVNAAATTTGTGESAVTTVTTDGSTTSVAVTLDNDYSGKIAVPANVATLTVTGPTITAGQLQLVTTQGTYDNLLSYSAGAVSLNPSAYYQNGEGEANKIYVEPKTAASDPMTMPGATTAPSFSIKTIPGLYYVVRSGTDPSSLTAGSATQATTTTTGLTGPALGNEDTVRYYKISVGRTAAEAAQ